MFQIDPRQIKFNMLVHMEDRAYSEPKFFLFPMGKHILNADTLLAILFLLSSHILAMLCFF